MFTTENRTRIASSWVESIWKTLRTIIFGLKVAVNSARANSMLVLVDFASLPVTQARISVNIAMKTVATATTAPSWASKKTAKSAREEIRSAIIAMVGGNKFSVPAKQRKPKTVVVRAKRKATKKTAA